MSNEKEEIKIPQNENADALSSISYPADTLKNCIELTDEVVKVKGTVTPLTRQEISIITGKAKPTLIMKLSTCVQFGIMNNVYGKGYQPSQLYDQYINPTYVEDKKEGAIQNDY